MFYDNFISLCVKNNQAPSYVIKNLGMSVGVLQKWKSGTLPYDTTIVKIANYFGVPASVLKEEPTKEKPAVLGENNGTQEAAAFDGDAFLQSILDEFTATVHTAYEQGKKEAALTDDERELLRLYRRAEEADKQKILSMIRAAFG